MIDQSLDHPASVYFNQRATENDAIIRKIDRLPTKIEQSLCELILLQINLKKEVNFYRAEVKKQKDFSLVVLFKEIAFEDQSTAAKQIHIGDIVRFFRVNGLAVDESRVRFNLFERVLGGRIFDY